MRRKTRQRYTWFPNLGFQGTNPEDDFNGFPWSLTVPNTSGELSDALLFQLIPDFNPEEPDASNNLSDFIGNEYILKRIVGKLFASFGGNGAAAPISIILGVGFFIARTEADNADVPIGAQIDAAHRKLNYGVLNNQNIREPWIWRRTWMLKDRDNNPSGVGPGLDGTYAGGSLQDGPHIDAKSARRVRTDERVFVSIQAGNHGATAAATGQVDGYLDYRLLGALRKAKNRSAF